MSEQIEAIREVIDIMDATLLDVINRRVALTGRIGELKRTAELPCRDPIREANLRQRIALVNSGPLRDATAHRIFELIIAECRTFQRVRDLPPQEEVHSRP